ncbi:MAG TPA: helix-turn-helix transcriptional regulator [Microbacterium sp.]|uniref:helix-turn-helix domain-containing protein n=1 Tax=Microbacterium sp. TaxID=51671 RepID=UPI002F943BD3
MNWGNASLSRLIAEALDRAFLESGMTQEQVGEASGISQSQVSKYLRGVRVPDVDQLDALCDALGLDIAAVVATAKRQRRTR